MFLQKDYCTEDDIRLNNNYGRPKFLSSSEIPRSDKDWIFTNLGDDEGDVFPGDNSDDVDLHNALNALISQQSEEEEHSLGTLGPLISFI